MQPAEARIEAEHEPQHRPVPPILHRARARRSGVCVPQRNCRRPYGTSQIRKTIFPSMEAGSNLLPRDMTVSEIDRTGEYLALGSRYATLLEGVAYPRCDSCDTALMAAARNTAGVPLESSRPHQQFNRAPTARHSRRCHARSGHHRRLSDARDGARASPCSRCRGSDRSVLNSETVRQRIVRRIAVVDACVSAPFDERILLADER